MNGKDLKHFLSQAYSKADYDFLFKKASIEQDFFNTVWALAENEKDSYSWRLLWILDHATEKNNQFIFPILEKLYERVIETKNESYIRQAMKLILRCPIDENYAGQLIDRCVEWMNDPKAKISSQCFGLEFFYRMCLIYPEMSPELLAHINDIIERSPSSGYKFRLKQIRNLLIKGVAGN